MENIVIDAFTGDVAVKSMIKCVMPSMHDSSVLKAVHRILKDHAGPKMSSRLINGRHMAVASLGLCYVILAKMTGHEWTTWRQRSGQAFKQALRERVQQARSMSQMDQAPPLRQQQVAAAVARVQSKSSVLQQALRSVNVSGSVRIHENTGKVSVIDVVRLLCPDKSIDYVKTSLSRVIAKDDRVISIRSRVSYIKINGRGHTTPVADFQTIVEIIWMLPSGASRAFRRKSAETICRVMGGDLSLCRQIEDNNLMWGDAEGGEAYQQALLEPVEYKDGKKSNRVMESSVRDALASSVAGEKEVSTLAGNIDVLSDTEVIEVKYYRQWKHGLGQVLAYQSYYPYLAKRVHLFAQTGDKDTEKYLALARSVCGAHSVNVTFEEVVLEGTVIDLGDGDAKHGEKRARADSEYDQMAGRGVSKRFAAYLSKQQCEQPPWFQRASVEEKGAYASMEAKKSVALGEIDILRHCKEQLELVGRFHEVDQDEFADNIRSVQRRHV